MKLWMRRQQLLQRLGGHSEDVDSAEKERLELLAAQEQLKRVRAEGRRPREVSVEALQVPRLRRQVHDHVEILELLRQGQRALRRRKPHRGQLLRRSRQVRLGFRHVLEHTLAQLRHWLAMQVNEARVRRPQGGVAESPEALDDTDRLRVQQLLALDQSRRNDLEAHEAQFFERAPDQGGHQPLRADDARRLRGALQVDRCICGPRRGQEQRETRRDLRPAIQRRIQEARGCMVDADHGLHHSARAQRQGAWVVREVLE
mmetsp:Transcript_8170/g.20510  ORF Transcript_8170/g.20510 Transcript_8170/m.20510 type:complete len:259 (-) Transcript_8170:2092-2868(-)